MRETLDEVSAELGAPTTRQEAAAELIENVFGLEHAKKRHLAPPIIEPETVVRDFTPFVPESRPVAQYAGIGNGPSRRSPNRWRTSE